jgi:broad specificity phosphatase PhoE
MSATSRVSNTTSTSQEVCWHTRTVVFLRHGVAHHNFQGAPLESPSLTDPSLRVEGKMGAIQAGHVIKHWLHFNRKETIDLVVCSPLTRTLQTATLAFGLPGDDDYSSNTPPILCIENVREASGKHYPDKRRNLSLLKVCN